MRIILVAAIGAAACTTPPPPAPVTSVLFPPGGEAYEPTVAIDPANPDHLIVAAMNGMPPVGKSTGINAWSSLDGGRTWQGAGLATPRLAGTAGPQVFGADVVAAFTADGTPLLASMSGVGESMGVFLSRVPGGFDSATAVPAFVNSRDSATGATTMYDKDWLIVDRRADSPRRGTVYLSTGAIVMAALPDKLGNPWQGPLVSRIDLRASDDGGLTFGPTVTVSADSAFSAQLAVTTGGALEVTYARLVDKRGAAMGVFHRRSTDGGATFGPEAPVAVMTGDTLLDSPVLAGRPNGDLLACWSEGNRADDRSNQVRCATRPAGGSWSASRPVDPALPAGVAEAWPALAGTDRGWYLGQFVVTASRTEFVLYRSDDGAAFERVGVLGAVDGVGLDHFCTNAVTPCRRSRPDGFTQGDYTALSVSGERLAAAFVLPRVLAPTPDSGAVHVTVMPEPAPGRARR
jgi:hypothetical protein